MPEDGPSLLLEFRELFEELGTTDGYVKLQPMKRSSTTRADNEKLPPVSLYKVIINDPADRAELGLSSIDNRIYRVWGGAIEPTGLLETTENAWLSAMIGGGGVIEGTRLFSLQDYQRGFSVGDTVMQWYLITSALKISR